MTPFAVKYRYSEFSKPSLPDTKAILEILKEFKDYIKNKIIREK